MLNLAIFETANSFCLDFLITFADKAQSKLIIGGASKTSTKSVKRPAGRTSKSTPSFWLFWVFSSGPEVIFNNGWRCFSLVPESVRDLFLPVHSLYPHLFSRAYINFKNPEDILLFRDRFDGYVFIDNKGKFQFVQSDFSQYVDNKCRRVRF